MAASERVFCSRHPDTSGDSEGWNSACLGEQRPKTGPFAPDGQTVVDSFPARTGTCGGVQAAM